MREKQAGKEGLETLVEAYLWEISDFISCFLCSMSSPEDSEMNNMVCAHSPTEEVLIMQLQY